MAGESVRLVDESPQLQSSHSILSTGTTTSSRSGVIGAVDATVELSLGVGIDTSLETTASRPTCGLLGYGSVLSRPFPP